MEVKMMGKLYVRKYQKRSRKPDEAEKDNKKQ
jgi:hypothetical protein